MSTNPTTRVTDLARRFRLDIDTATYPAVSYQQLLGVQEAKLIEELRKTPDETYDDNGAMRQAVTGYSWRIELKIKYSKNPAGTSRDTIQAFIRSKHKALRSSDTTDGEFGVRWYDRSGLGGDDHEGRVFVDWTPDGGASEAQDIITLVLNGQGELASISNPLGSLVPAVTGLSPATGAAAGGELIQIYGDHFTGATAVAFAASTATFTVVSDSLIVAVAPAHAAGTVQAKVTTPAGNSPNVAADDYVYV